MIEIIDHIPVEIKPENILKVMCLKVRQPRIEAILAELIPQAMKIARPKALYKVAYIDKKGDDTIEIEGITFHSHVLRVNIDKIERVFPYVGTCGRELDELDAGGDALRQLCLDNIKMVTVGLAMNYLFGQIKNKYQLGQTAHMNPGSLVDWPITQQRPLFSLFEGQETTIGVRLTEGCMMQPMKSVSGIFYTSEVKYENCQLCPREGCMGRRAPYSPELVEKYKTI